MFQPFIEFYQKHACPNCKAVNWTYHSHSLRSNPISPEICKCHSCQKKYWLIDEDAVDDFYRKEDYEISEGETLMDVCGADEADGTPEP
jgi:hypothetical protein